MTISMKRSDHGLMEQVYIFQEKDSAIITQRYSEINSVLGITLKPGQTKRFRVEEVE